MTHRRFHAIEKKQVQLAAAGGLAIVYFYLWTAIRSSDPGAPVSLVANGGPAAFGVFAVTLLALAAVSGMITIGTRPAGALLATLVAAGAVSLRCASIRVLLWSHQDKLGLLFAKLIGEVLLLTFLAICAGLIISFVHWAMSRLNPRWAWRHRADGLTDKQQGDADRPQAHAALPSLLRAVIAAARPVAARKADRRLAIQVLLRAVYCVGVGTAIAIALTLVVMKSGDRGQIIFALVGSLFVAAYLAYQAFPVASSLPAMAMMVLSAVALYALAAAMSISGAHGAWMNVKFFAQAMPVDWLAAGGGGAVLGYWVSSRAKEARHWRQIEEKSEGE